MSACPWMPFYVADYLADTGNFRAAESGAYMHLIMHYWRRGGLPDDDRQLSVIARMTPEEWASAKALIEPLFQPGWKHKRVEKELAKAAQKIESGRKGGRSKAKRNPSEQPSETLADDVANSKRNPSDPPSTPVKVKVVVPSEQLGLSDKQDSFKLESEERKKDPVVTRAKPGCRLPHDWQPTLDDLAFARTLLSDDAVKRQVDVFRDYWHARAGPNSTKADWSATWRNWIRKELGNGNGYRNGNGSGSSKNQQGRGHSALAGDYFGRHATEID